MFASRKTRIYTIVYHITTMLLAFVFIIATEVFDCSWLIQIEVLSPLSHDRHVLFIPSIFKKKQWILVPKLYPNCVATF